MWLGKFVKDAGTIEELHDMICFYKLKQYNIPLLEYNGGQDFNLRIFNCYGVEIDYGWAANTSEYSIMARQKMINTNQCLFKCSKVELEKLAIAFTFNVYHNTQNTWEVKLEVEHVEIKEFHQVSSIE